jgi:hypothetical protein
MTPTTGIVTFAAGVATATLATTTTTGASAVLFVNDTAWMGYSTFYSIQTVAWPATAGTVCTRYVVQTPSAATGQCCMPRGLCAPTRM